MSACCQPNRMGCGRWPSPILGSASPVCRIGKSCPSPSASAHPTGSTTSSAGQISHGARCTLPHSGVLYVGRSYTSSRYASAAYHAT